MFVSFFFYRCIFYFLQIDVCHEFNLFLLLWVSKQRNAMDWNVFCKSMYHKHETHRTSITSICNRFHLLLWLVKHAVFCYSIPKLHAPNSWFTKLVHSIFQNIFWITVQLIIYSRYNIAIYLECDLVITYNSLYKLS